MHRLHTEATAPAEDAAPHKQNTEDAYMLRFPVYYPHTCIRPGESCSASPESRAQVLHLLMLWSNHNLQATPLRPPNEHSILRGTGCGSSNRRNGPCQEAATRSYNNRSIEEEPRISSCVLPVYAALGGPKYGVDDSAEELHACYGKEDRGRPVARALEQDACQRNPQDSWERPERVTDAQQR